jgi:hypothetical protein
VKPKPTKRPKALPSLESLGPDTPLAVLQAVVRAIIEKHSEGVCPTCGRFFKVYVHVLHRQTAANLIAFHSRSRGGWLSVEAMRDLTIDRAFPSTLVHWGLVEQHALPTGSHKRTSGQWRLTALGRAFVECRVAIPKEVYTYDGQRRGASDARVTIRDAVEKGGRFDYRELMARRPPAPVLRKLARTMHDGR